ncbi:hypothetical protein [Pseudomonas rubra]|uniref:PH domain-containing protein n=1 Tax=Pseudomonas rubra TaxID=2942627 RepID=A0ABT5PAA6_9PSED|nr:hypothetical protein [Pseudomonas rubra]MDD1015203.1 hypothetical protein [Pseudomonas rubra]MDD1037857.1 hypothetical protein [Pseudomonas rubra]MDD1152815.1 hypothetical protein [Pseudomonas rubra]
MFKLHQIWKRSDETTAIVYYCFEDLSNGKFCVQHADFFRSPSDELKLRSDQRTIELFIEQSPRDRCHWAESIRLAIELHDADFANFNTTNSHQET